MKQSLNFPQSVNYVNNTCTHSQFFNSIGFTCLWVPHLPNTVLFNSIYPFLRYFSVKVKLIIVFQSLENKIIGSSPRRTSPHQIYSVNGVIGGVRPGNSRDRVLRFVVLFLSRQRCTLVSRAMMPSLCF